MLDSDPLDDAIFGFHAQQTTEKAFKAWLAQLGIQYPRTHDLGLLLNLLETSGSDISPWLDLVDLSAYAVQFRYEAYDSDDMPLDREAMIERIRSLLEHLEQ